MTATAAADPPPALDKDDPLRSARLFLDARFAHADHCRLVYASEQFYAWDGRQYRIQEAAGLRSQLYQWLERQSHYRGENRWPFQPNKTDVNNLVDALAGAVYIDAQPPCWLANLDGDLPNPEQLLVGVNGYLDMSDPDAGIVANTPALFTVNSIDYPIERDAPPPSAWLAFLDALWPNDADSQELLQEWFGYCLTGDTSAQKMLLLIGPPRSGKGTIARVLSRLLGHANVCAPTLAGLGTNFGLSALIDKRLGIVADARLSGRTDIAIVTERLLSISGEDMQTIDRKNKSAVSVKLPTRLMLCTNELPRMPDASGALASRFLILTLSVSHLGKEDPRLTDRLFAELPGILMWALDGWTRLRDRGRFTQPHSGRHALDELADLSSPVKKFADDWCRVITPKPGEKPPDFWITVADLYEAWKQWCGDEGHRPGSKAIFSRDLQAAFPQIDSTQRRIGGEGDRPRIFTLIELNPSAQMIVSQRRGNGEPYLPGVDTYL